MSITESQLKNINGMIYKKAYNNSQKNNIVVFNYDDVLLPEKYYLYTRIEIPIDIIRDFIRPYINADGDKK